MSLRANNKGGGGNFELVPPGIYAGRCYQLVDLGTQTVTNSYGTKEKEQVQIGWELAGVGDDGKPVLMADGRPFAIFRTYTNSLYETSDLFKDLSAWRGRKFTDDELEDFDLTTIVGAYCQIQVVHNPSTDGKRTYANISSIMGIGQVPKFDPKNDDMVFTTDEITPESFNHLPNYLKLKIQRSPEFKAAGTVKGLELGTDDPTKPADVPPAKATTKTPSAGVEIQDLDEQETINVNDVPF